jgi:hypothetical protein
MTAHVAFSRNAPRVQKLVKNISLLFCDFASHSLSLVPISDTTRPSTRLRTPVTEIASWCHASGRQARGSQNDSGGETGTDQELQPGPKASPPT